MADRLSASNCIVTRFAMNDKPQNYPGNPSRLLRKRAENGKQRAWPGMARCETLDVSELLM
jgi:hypothetical protein